MPNGSSSFTGIISSAKSVQQLNVHALNIGGPLDAESITTDTITHASLGPAEDMTISLTGATDSSLDISSTGTGADAIKLTASAGGIDITAVANSDIDITTSGTGAVNMTGVLNASNIYQGSATGTTLALGTYNTAGGADTLTAAELLSGYTYNGTAGGNVALTLPGADAVQTALAAIGITTAAGLRLPDIIIQVTDANSLTVTAGAGESVVGTALVNDGFAIVKYVMTAADEATAFIFQG